MKVPQKNLQMFCELVTLSSVWKEIVQKANIKNKFHGIDERISYHKWLIINDDANIKGKEKIGTGKQIILCSTFMNSIQQFLVHVRNVRHQYKIFGTIQKNLSTEELFIHVDFYENYQCEYKNEVHSLDV